MAIVWAWLNALVFGVAMFLDAQLAHEPLSQHSRLAALAVTRPDPSVQVSSPLPSSAEKTRVIAPGENVVG